MSKTDQITEQSDFSLIQMYLDNDNEAIEVLVKRHYPTTYKRFRAHGLRAEDAEDLAQQTWIRVIDSLPKYQDRGKFTAFLATVSGNLMKDHWKSKGIKNKIFVDGIDADKEQSGPVSLAKDPMSEVLPNEINKEAIEYLSNILIPNLPCDQRLAYLLRHESEFWEPLRPLLWEQLAKLNGVSIVAAWHSFRQARQKLFDSTPGRRANLECLELLIFLVWTQSQRPLKAENTTEKDFADLIDIPVNTFKTRYRAALKTLAEGMRNWKDNP